MRHADEAVGHALRQQDGRGLRDRRAVDLLQQVALEPLSDLAGRDGHAEAGEVDERAVDAAQPGHLDLPEVVLPLEESQRVVAAGNEQDQRHQFPAEVAEAFGDLLEIAIRQQSDEDEDAEQHRYQQPVAELGDVHAGRVYRQRIGIHSEQFPNGEARAAHTRRLGRPLERRVEARPGRSFSIRAPSLQKGAPFGRQE